MDKFFFEVPSIRRKQDAIDYIKEFKMYNSRINGVGELDNYLLFNDYEGWLLKLEDDYVRVPSEEGVPTRTYFFVRESDNRIIGMINIRLVLNERLKKIGGNIGYSIRPTERNKGYNKINLYLGLKICKEYGLDKVFLDALKDNIASWKTMESLGGYLIRDYYESTYFKDFIKDYEIDINKCLVDNKKYEMYVLNTR
jgi:predicted acetyltransferase